MLEIALLRRDEETLFQRALAGDDEEDVGELGVVVDFRGGGGREGEEGGEAAGAVVGDEGVEEEFKVFVWGPGGGGDEKLGRSGGK